MLRLLFHRTTRRSIYYGTQVVLKSSDRGVTWTEISPDLTRNDLEKQGRNGGPLTPENVGAEYLQHDFLHRRIASRTGPHLGRQR